MPDKIFLKTAVGWGLLLWLFGYILGFVFYFIPYIPLSNVGWYIMPFGIAATLWILLKKINFDKFSKYIILGFIWMLIAVLFDFLFLVKLLNPVDYYKLDVYIYYLVTLIFPIAYGWWKIYNPRFKM